MNDEPGHPADRPSEDVWVVLGMIRDALEESLPPGWVRPAGETPNVVSAEVDVLVAAIHLMAKAIPPERLNDRIV
jgi:hypothetical protein